jgi:hypothetical protein
MLHKSKAVGAIKSTNEAVNDFKGQASREFIEPDCVPSAPDAQVGIINGSKNDVKELALQLQCQSLGRGTACEDKKRNDVIVSCAGEQAEDEGRVDNTCLDCLEKRLNGVAEDEKQGECAFGDRSNAAALRREARKADRKSKRHAAVAASSLSVIHGSKDNDGANACGWDDDKSSSSGAFDCDTCGIRFKSRNQCKIFYLSTSKAGQGNLL